MSAPTLEELHAQVAAAEAQAAQARAQAQAIADAEREAAEERLQALHRRVLEGHDALRVELEQAWKAAEVELHRAIVESDLGRAYIAWRAARYRMVNAGGVFDQAAHALGVDRASQSPREVREAHFLELLEDVLERQSQRVGADVLDAFDDARAAAQHGEELPT